MLLSINIEPNDRFRDYRSFGAAVESLGEARQVIRNAWLLHPQEPNMNRVVEMLVSSINPSTDRLFVADITGHALNGWLRQDLWEWANRQNH